MALVEDLYYPGSLAVDRKRTSADSLAAWKRPEGMRVRSHSRRWKPWEDQALPAANNPASSAVELDRTETSCKLRLWRLRSGRVAMPTDHLNQP